jgi:small subunit ribosomal protein S17
MPNNRRRLQGTVVSNKMDKTVKVRVESTERHPLYGKIIRTHKHYLAHDESNALQVGDVVRMVESRPLSRHKRWVVEEVVTKAAEIAEVPAGE